MAQKTIEQSELRLLALMRAAVIEQINYAIDIGEIFESIPIDPSNKEKNLLAESLNQVRNTKEVFIENIDSLEVDLLFDWRSLRAEPADPTEGKMYFGLWALMFSVFVSSMNIVHTAGMSDYAERVRKSLSALKMRQKKRAKQEKEEIALMAAILAEHGSKISRRPSKEAYAILSAVNRRLGIEGLKEVKVDKIRRRLEGLSALLENAKNGPE